MKKTLLLVAICVCLAITTFASANEVYEYEYEDQGMTIVFEETSNLTNEERQYLADLLVYGDNSTESSSTYALCWLTGHDYQYDYVTAIQHKVSSEAPRCYEITYEVETCSNCDHMEYTEICSVYIFCCPEE